MALIDSEQRNVFIIIADMLCVFEQPSLNPDATGDVVLLNRWSVRNHQVQRGDVVSVL